MVDNFFVNRKEELTSLKKLYLGKTPKLVIFYGRRRVGKTELLRQFAKKYKALYLLGRQESEKEQLRRFSEEIAEFFKDNVLKLNPFTNWDALLTYLAEKLKEKKIPIFFDEYPYMIDSNKSLPSILQDYWDNKFSKIDAFFILCGSSISMMEELVSYKSPLYGRRTEQILLEPLNFFQATEFFTNLNKEESVRIYSILGGTPAYLLEFNYERDLEFNIKENILQKKKFLYEDVLFVLREELQEPRNYFSILHSISKGNTKLGEIVNDTGFNKGLVSKYLSVLSSLHIVERRIPITEKNPQKSRKGIFFIKDNYFKFWFRFVFANAAYIEQKKTDMLLKDKIEPELNSYIGKQFEEIVFQWLQIKFPQYLWGRWWHQDKEIDCVGLDKANKKIVFVEAKWSSLSDKEIGSLLSELKKKAEFVDWEMEERSEEFIIIAKKIHNKTKNNVRLFDLNDLQI